MVAPVTGVHVSPPSVLYSIVSSTPPISPSLASAPLGFFVTAGVAGASGVTSIVTTAVSLGPSPVSRTRTS